MPQDVFPETKLNISLALQISDGFVIEGSDVIPPLGQPRIEEPRLLIGKPIL